VPAKEEKAMINVILARLKQGHRTIKYPKGAPPAMPDRFRGRPLFDSEKCFEGCRLCIEACPSDALDDRDGKLLDLGKCLFCTDCARVCPAHAVSFSDDYRLAVRRRGDFILPREGRELLLAGSLDAKMKKIFGRSLKLRQVSAGGCGACEADVNVLGTIGWDLGRFGIQFVASPRHADGVLITGPVTRNMITALRKTYDAVPEPKLVISVGACAISGGPCINHDSVKNGIDSLLPVDLYIPGCPPHPLTILDGLLRLLGKIEDGSRSS